MSGSKISNAPRITVLQFLLYIWKYGKLHEGWRKQGRDCITRKMMCSLEGGYASEESEKEEDPGILKVC